MSIEVRRATAEDLDRWDDFVEQSPQATPFHRRAVLDVVADHSGATLHPLVGYKGQEPVGLFPVFEYARGPVTAALSPPPDLKVSYLGPALLNQSKLKTRKRERRHRRFAWGCLDWLGDHVDPSYVHVRTGVRYDDPRPFEWREFDVDPGYTYVVDLDRSEDDLLAAFSSDARQNVRGEVAERLDVEVRGGEAIAPIVDQVRERHEAQGESYHVTPEFVRDLHEAAPGVVRPYAVTLDDRFVGGMVVLCDDDTAYRWQGGAKPDADAPVNDVLDWRVIRDAIADGRSRYDLVGANERRLCGYKAKFDPDLRTYRSLTRGSRGVEFASKLYGALR